MNAKNDVFLRDRQLGVTTYVVLSSSGAQLDDYVGARFSANGRFVAFSTRATNAVPGDTNQLDDLFVRDLFTSTTELLSLTPTGAQVSQPSASYGGFTVPAALSSDGRWLAFYSDYSDLVAGDSNGTIDGFVLERQPTVAPVTTYCPAKVTSTGCTPVITSAGEPRASGFDSFYVSASKVRAATRGAFSWSLAAASTPFGGGTLCVAAPYRFEGVASGTYGGTGRPCNQGQFVFKPSHAFFATHSLTPGTTIFAQFLSRDNGFAPPNNIGLTDAIAFTIAP